MLFLPFFVHSDCVNFRRVDESDVYYCPFCREIRIKCSCGNNNNYSDRLIQCSRCKFWVHKKCEGLDYGFIPKDFICKSCKPERQFLIPFQLLDPFDLNFIGDIISHVSDKALLIQSIPKGNFKNFIVSDLSSNELYFLTMISIYFLQFTSNIFSRDKEFWAILVDSFSKIFQLHETVIFTTIDKLANNLLYKNDYVQLNRSVGSLEITTKARNILDSMTIEVNERLMMPKEILIDEERRVTTYTMLNNGEFVCELSGVLMTKDEVDSDEGIPRYCITVTNQNLVIDVRNSLFSQAQLIKRSFHYNCIVKIEVVKKDIRVCIYAINPSGPLAESAISPAIFE